MMSIENLSLRIDDHLLLDDVNFVVPRGGVTGILGPNGAGKSTVLRTILGLATAGSGNIFLKGQDITFTATADRARAMAYLPQDSYVYWPIDVETLVSLGRFPHRTPFSGMTDEDRAAIERAMEQTDVVHLRHRPVSVLSGGERMRVMLARALATEASVLLADEPVAALDPLHVLQVMQVFDRLAREGKAVVIVLHDLSLAAKFCRHIVLIKDGRIIASGVPGDVMTPENLELVYGVKLVGNLTSLSYDFELAE